MAVSAAPRESLGRTEVSAPEVHGASERAGWVCQEGLGNCQRELTADVSGEGQNGPPRAELGP